MVDDDDEAITDQYLRDPFDVISYYQTNMLCRSFTAIGESMQDDTAWQIE
jgi:hypothetical protein